MQVKVGNKFFIKSDSSQYTLYKLTKKGEAAKNPGEDNLMFVGYYGHIEHLIKEFPDKVLLNSDCTALSEAVKEVQQLGKDLREALKVPL